MPDNASWNPIRLGRITSKIGSGATPKGGKESYQHTGISLIRSLNVYDFHFEKDGLAHIDEDQAAQLAGVTVESDDILLNITGASVARCCMVPQGVLPARVNQHVAIVRVRKDVADPSFVFYCLNSPRYKSQLLALAQGGATREALTKETIENFQVSLPVLAVQQRLSSVLRAYDDLVENNTRRIEILEEMAQMIHREWFVNFRFPGYEKVTMVETELGPVPDNWKIIRLEDVVEEIIDYRGKTPKKLGGEWSEHGVLALSALNVKQGRLENLDKARFVSEDLYRKWMKSELKSGDILMTSEAPLGEVYFLPETRKYCLSQRVFSMRANPAEISPAVLYFFLSSHNGQSQIKAKASGTTVLGIRQADLRRILVMQPDLATQQKAESILIPFLREIDVLHQQNANICQTRDFLLPKLISGQIGVEQFEVEAVAQNV